MGEIPHAAARPPTFSSTVTMSAVFSMTLTARVVIGDIGTADIVMVDEAIDALAAVHKGGPMYHLHALQLEHQFSARASIFSMRQALLADTLEAVGMRTYTFFPTRHTTGYVQWCSHRPVT